MSFKKRLTALTLAGVMVLGSVGCSSNKESAQEPSADGKLSGNVVVWSWTETKTSLEEASELFKKEHPDVTFEFVDLAAGDLATKLATCFQTGQGLPDVATVEGDTLQGLVSKFPKSFADTSETIGDIKDSYLPYKLEEVTFDGAQKAIPYDASPSMMYYRADLFEKAGINAEDIKTWSDYIEAGKILKEKTDASIITNDYAGDDGLYRQMMMQQGSFYLDKDNNVALDSAESKKAVEVIKTMHDAGIMNNHKSWDDMISVYKNDKVATAVFGSWFIGTLKSNGISDGNWAVMPMPAFEEGGQTSAVNGGSDIIVPEQAQNKAVALEFAKFASSSVDATKNLFTKYGQLPASTSAYEDEIFKAGDEFFGGQAIWQTFIDSGKNATPPNYSANYQEIKKQVCDHMAKILLKGEPVDATLKNLQTEGEKIVNK